MIIRPTCPDPNKPLLELDIVDDFAGGVYQPLEEKIRDRSIFLPLPGNR